MQTPEMKHVVSLLLVCQNSQITGYIHTLDLVISRETDDIVQNCEVGTFASDHNVVTFTLRSGNYHPQRKTVAYVPGK